MDTIVMTWTGCSIPEIRTALEEMRRVLRPGGRLLFVEHGRAPEPRVARWQDRLTPFWQRFSGGCRLNRKIDDLLSDAGFQIDRLATGYIPGPRIMTFLYKDPRCRGDAAGYDVSVWMEKDVRVAGIVIAAPLPLVGRGSLTQATAFQILRE
jgi:SAM-dependent methyltransferase